MDDQGQNYLIKITVKGLGISNNQAKLRLEAFLKSGVLAKYKNPKPEGNLFQIITDIAMQIPQLQAVGYQGDPYVRTTILQWLSENDTPTRIRTILSGTSTYGYCNSKCAQKLEYIEDITEGQWLACYLGSESNWKIFKKLRGY